MEQASEKVRIPQKKKSSIIRFPKKLQLGDSVKVLSMNLKGTVQTLPDARGNLFVQMGILRSQVNIKDLVLLEAKRSVKKQVSQNRHREITDVQNRLCFAGDQSYRQNR